MNFEVGFSASALRDLDRLNDHLLERATTIDDVDRASRAVDQIQFVAQSALSCIPYSFRKAGSSPLLRELVIPFGASGYVALYRIEPGRVVILAVRHQLEDDYL